MFECKVCGRKFGKITASHLKLHNMTRSEYRELYGEEGLIQIGNLFVKNIYNEIDEYSLLRTLAFKTKRFKNGESVKRNRHFQ
jgi:hypothetical protein